MGKKFSIIILLTAIITINISVVCQTLCLTGHGDMAKHGAKGDVCPIDHSSNHSSQHKSGHTANETFIKCDCSSHFEASLDYEIALTSAVNLTSYFKNISEVQPYKTIFVSSELIPLEEPPEILA